MSFMNAHQMIRDILSGGPKTTEEVFTQSLLVAPWFTLIKCRQALAMMKSKGMLTLEAEYKGKTFYHNSRGAPTKAEGMTWRYHLQQERLDAEGHRIIPGQGFGQWYCKYQGEYWHRLNQEAPPSPEVEWVWYPNGEAPEGWNGEKFCVSEAELRNVLEQADVQQAQRQTNNPQLAQSEANDGTGAAVKDT